MQHTFRTTKTEEDLLNALCARTHRNLADTVRYALWLLAIREGITNIPYTQTFVVPEEVMQIETPV